MFDKKWLFVPYVLEAATQDPGVYVLWRHEEVIYIGCASNIQARLLEHAVDEALPTHYWWDTHEDPGAAAAALLDQYRRLHGELPRLNRN